MTSPLFEVLARTLTASSLAEICVLETAAHGTVTTRAGFVRCEVVRDVIPGEIPLLTGDPMASIAEASAPGTDVGDVIWVSGKLWNVRAPLADGGGMLRLQLSDAKRETVEVEDDTVEVVVVGDLDDAAPVVALAPSGVLRRSDVVSLDGDAYRVGTPTDWPADRPVGSLRRYVLTSLGARRMEWPRPQLRLQQGTLLSQHRSHRGRLP